MPDRKTPDHDPSCSWNSNLAPCRNRSFPNGKPNSPTGDCMWKKSPYILLRAENSRGLAYVIEVRVPKKERQIASLLEDLVFTDNKFRRTILELLLPRV